MDTEAELGDEPESISSSPQLPAHEVVDRLFITTPPAQAALEAMNVLLKHGRRADYCECLLIAGPSRVGKSAVLRHFASLHPPSIAERQIIRPVIIVKLRDVTRVWSLTSALLRELGDPRPDHGSPGARDARAVALLRAQQVQLVIFDEFQHLIDSDTDKIAYRAADTVKSLIENNVCPVVMCGVSHAIRVFWTNNQLISRARAPLMMAPADWRLSNERLAFRIFLNQLEDALQLPAPSGLGEFHTAHRIHHMSRGLYGHASNLVREALLIRYRNGDVSSCITQEQLAEAAGGLLSREPTARLNAFRTAPPDIYEPAPVFETLKEPVIRRKQQTEANDVDF